MEQPTTPEEPGMTQPDNIISRPTLFESITYDVDVIQKMTVSELLIQQIARQDLHFPHRERNLDADTFRRDVVATVAEFIGKLEQVPLPSLAAELMVITEKYLEGFGGVQ